jgi:hypothetical protein
LRPLGGVLVKWSIHYQCGDHLHSLDTAVAQLSGR